MDINDLIAAERNYFAPMIVRERSTPSAQREVWRSETIRQRQARISLEVYEMTGGEVKYGPFSGMKLSADPHWGLEDLGSQCLGLYELEMLRIIEAIDEKQFNRFIDIGAADGYYTTGLLFSQKVNEALCFEQTSRGRQAIKDNWLLNGSPGALDIRGFASGEALTRVPGEFFERSLVLIDIEGGEFDFLTDDVLQLLCSCTLLIEIHNWIDDFQERYSDLLSRIGRIFQVSVVERLERPTLQIPELRDFTDDNRLLLTSERRPCVMRFLRLDPKT